MVLHHDTALIPNAAERGGQKCAPMTLNPQEGCPEPEYLPLSLRFPYAFALPPQHAAPCLTLSCPPAGSALFLKHLWTCPTRPLSAPMPPPLFDALESTTASMRKRSRGSGAAAAAVASKSRRSTTAAAAAAVAAAAAAASGAAARGHQRKMAARGRAVAPFAAPCLDMHQSYRV